LIRHQVIIPLLGLAVLLALVVFSLLHQDQAHPSRPALSWRHSVDDPPLPDLSGERDVHTRKVRFFKYLLPLVRRENRRLADIRKQLGYIQEQIRCGHELDTEDRRWLHRIGKKYRLDCEGPADQQFWSEIDLRVDQIPESLVLVQAANESAWGTSRFAREGNNLFGQWCFTPGCGMVPDVRPEGETHEVARFESVAHSIASYMHNLNAGYAYEDLRKIRADLKRQGKRVTAEDLVGGLISYSQRRESYVNELLAMLRTNIPIIEEIRPSRSGKPEA
jgi:Bax protein